MFVIVSHILNIKCFKTLYLSSFSLQAMKAKQRMREIFVKCLNQNRDPNGSLCSVLEEYHTTGSRDLDIQKDQLFLDAIIELLFFGAETITSAGFSIIYNLTKNGEIFDKLKDTINNNDNDVYSRQDLQLNNYADLIIKESLRVFPPVGGAYRKVIKAFELDVSFKNFSFFGILNMQDASMCQQEFNTLRYFY